MTETKARRSRPVRQARAREIAPTVNPKGEMLWESSPSRYIAKVSLVTGKEILRPIDPDELLVHAHRDKNPIEVTAAFLASRLISWTGNERRRQGRPPEGERPRHQDRRGARLGHRQPRRREAGAKRLIGVAERDVFFKFREASHLSEKEVKARVEKLQKDARALLRARGRSPKLHVLLTGATGFLGKEILVQAATDRRIERVVCVVRPETIRDPKTKEVVKVLSPRQRGAILLRSASASPARRRRSSSSWTATSRSRSLGIAPSELSRLKSARHARRPLRRERLVRRRVRELLPRERAGRAQRAASSRSRSRARRARSSSSTSRSRRPTSTGARSGRSRRRAALVFPRDFYNNFYELTKAMASLETDYTLIDKGLRVAQLLPSIVIGHSKTGNNRGDTKVVNAPINAFGRSQGGDGRPAGATRSGAARRGSSASIASSFPGDRSAELNLVPVDRVVAGHPRRAHGSGVDRRADPPRDGQPHPVRGHRPHHARGDRHRRAARRPDALPQRDAARS